MKSIVKRKRVSKTGGVMKRVKASKLSRLEKFIGVIPHTAPELKCVDISNGGAIIANNLSSTATYFLCNALVAGTNFYNRIGRQIAMKSLHVRGGVVCTNQAGNVNGEHFRIAVVYDRQPNGANPTYSDIFTSYDLNGTVSSGSATVFDGPNVNNCERFLILADEHVTLPSTAGATAAGVSTDQQQKITFDRFIDLKGLPVHYKGEAGTIADIATGALFVVTLGSQASASAACAFQWLGRLRYLDI